MIRAYTPGSERSEDMTAKQERGEMLSSYTTIYKRVEDQPEVLKFVSRRRKQIVINLAARKDAKIIKLLP